MPTVVLTVWALFAQVGGPSALSLPGGFLVHIRVSEGLDPDRLPALARAKAVLWVETRSNTLPSAWIERLASFREAYIQMRAPLRPEDVTQLSGAPRVGIWLSAADAVQVCHRLGTRPCAIAMSGELTEERWSQIVQGRARRVTWKPAVSGISLAEWSLWRQLSGRSGVELDGRVPERRIVLSPDIADDALRDIFVRHPDAQLEVRTGASFDLAVATGKLLLRLENAGPGH